MNDDFNDLKIISNKYACLATWTMLKDVKRTFQVNNEHPNITILKQSRIHTKHPYPKITLPLVKFNHSKILS